MLLCVRASSQVRECATALLQVAKREKVPVFLVGHVTKVRPNPPCEPVRTCAAWWHPAASLSQAVLAG